jgi:heme-degrading monooxygenase HmoA
VYARRCPERWRPAPADLETGRAEGFTDAEMARELAKFRDHQFKTAHTSWSAAFRNWLRTEADRRRERGGRGFSGLTLPERMDAEDARATQEALAILAARDRG